MRATDTRLLVIDELHNLLSGTSMQQRRLLNLLRWLGNELQIPLVGVGTAEALRAIRSDDQLVNRFEPFALPAVGRRRGISAASRDTRSGVAAAQAVAPRRSGHGRPHSCGGGGRAGRDYRRRCAGGCAGGRDRDGDDLGTHDRGCGLHPALRASACCGLICSPSRRCPRRSRHGRCCPFTLSRRRMRRSCPGSSSSAWALRQSPLMFSRHGFKVDAAGDPEWWRRPSAGQLETIAERTGSRSGPAESHDVPGLVDRT